ncbi:hypothetical protein [Pseudomonas sp. NFIX28]|uniref:hypothetical protein n=1 Tax=Pseudomonas sp. NFIX28 TaxID=1566235 RepID=UPI0008994F45|nr:hypothetical protein [Pseudomonas sp. NFIX28]SDY29645.1 hypothetical protein SAMN03159453_00136 [Pseudomonas sp. NFIX28]
MPTENKLTTVKRYWVHWNDQRYVADKDGDLVMAADFDRVLAERDALQQRLTVQDQRADELEGRLTERNALLARWLPMVDDDRGLEELEAETQAALSQGAPAADDDWRMSPCKQGHRDVGAAGGVAHCYQCDEKIEAATTQEAFELWNAAHPVAQA